MQTDPIADSLIAIKNAYMAKKDVTEIKSSKLLEKICEILKREGYIENYRKIEDNKQGILRIYLKYEKNRPAITQIKRISKPGRRVYVTKDKVPQVLQGYGIAILTTSKGVLTDKEARKLGVGGEVICYVW